MGTLLRKIIGATRHAALDKVEETPAMKRPTRRDFLTQAGIGASAFAVGSSLSKTWASKSHVRPRAPFKTLYSNDTTNITSCISPYHELGQPISDDRFTPDMPEVERS